MSTEDAGAAPSEREQVLEQVKSALVFSCDFMP